MARPLRIEFPGAIYHVTSRGDRAEPIYRDDKDRRNQLERIGQAMERFDAQVLAYCLMGNHYHLVLHTRRPNLSRLMRHINGVYTQHYNRRHGVVGHLFQGRFKAILVDREAYLFALCRYVERNPVAAGLVDLARDWRWSSYRAHVGLAPAPSWLDTDGLHSYVLGRDIAGHQDRRSAQTLYAQLAEQPSEADGSFWQDALSAQVFLGDKLFAARSQRLATRQRRADREIPRAQRKPPMNWPEWLDHAAGNRDAALHMAYREGGLTMSSLAQACGLSVSHVSRMVAKQEREERCKT